MLSVETKYFGTLTCDQDSVFDFPHGLPAFEEEKSFVLIEAREGGPLVFLQSMARASLCFVALPILVVDDHYQMAIAPEDLEELGLDTQRQPLLGSEITALALIAMHDQFLATANLMAPVILNTKSRCGVQAIRRDSRYSHEYPVAARRGEDEVSEGAC
jgi:flagellar assembly factor FliW